MDGKEKIYSPDLALTAVSDVLTWISFLEGSVSPVAEIFQRQTDQRGYVDLIAGRLPLLERICESLGVRRPLINDEPESDESTYHYVRESGIEARGILLDWKLSHDIFSRGGPKLDASELHLWVWSAAERLWSGGHFREALQVAASSVEVQTQAKSGRHDLSGPALPREVFNVKDPEPGKPRLRLDHPKGSENWTSAHEGAANFGAGCMLAIRNLATHGANNPSEPDALQQLAALSLLATWVDEATVESAP